MLPQKISPISHVPQQKPTPLSLAVRVPLAPIKTLTSEERSTQNMMVYIPELGEMVTMLLAYEVANKVLE